MIETRVDSKRGCGWRQEGGLYLVSSGESVSCGKLPVPLGICPTCSGGIHFARSWTWVDGDALLATKECFPAHSRKLCSSCPLGRPLGRCGLLWIGEKFYKTPAAWTKEAMSQGISRRIPAVPRDFELGKTLVLVAHLKAIRNRCSICDGRGTVVRPPLRLKDGDENIQGPPQKADCPNEECEKGFVFTAGIFSAFTPSAIEYVTKGTETQDEIDAIEKRGIIPIKVLRDEEATNGVQGIIEAEA